MVTLETLSLLLTLSVACVFATGSGNLLSTRGNASSVPDRAFVCPQEPDRPLDFFDDLRRNITDAERSDVVAVELGCERYDLRHLTSINPFLLGANGDRRQVTFDAAGSALLAVHHWNNGISDVVPEVGDVSGGCGIKFTIDFIDTQFSPIKASRDLVDDVFERGTEADPSKPFPTALIGASRSAVSAPLAILTGIHGLPQISYASASTVLDNKDQYPLFGRLVPSARGDASAAVSYLADRFQVSHLGVLFVRDEYGSTYAQAIHEAAEELDAFMHVDLSSFTFNPSEEEMRNAISQLKSSGCRYFIGIVFDRQYKAVMSEAHRQGIAGKGYFWMFSVSMVSVSGYTFDPASEGDIINSTHGAAIISIAFPSTRKGRPGFDAFMNHWDDLKTPEWRRYFDSKMPLAVQTSDGIGSGFEFSTMPGPFALSQYDALVALALAACDAGTKNKFFDGPTLYRSFLNTTFNGLYGRVAIDSRTGSRDSRTIPFSVSNLIPKPPDKNGMVSLELVTTDIYEESAGGVEWRNIGKFIFSDGSTLPPAVLPPINKRYHLLSTGAQTFGLILCGISMLLSIGFGMWTFHNRKNEVVEASEPTFLGMLCLGGLLLGMTIIPMSLQEPLCSHLLDVACMITPWLFSFGFIVAFSALFSKTMLVNKMSSSTRRISGRVSVKIKDLIKPFILLFATNCLVLTAWTIFAPLSYRYETTGSVDSFCRYNEFFPTCSPLHPGWDDKVFTLLWAAINVSALLYANLQAYRGRVILTEYSESHYIFISMAILLQAFIIGVPVMIFADDSPTVRYVVRCCLVFVTVVAVLIPIYIPKIMFLRQCRAHEKTAQRRLLLSLKKQCQMDALRDGDCSLTSWIAKQMDEHSGCCPSSRIDDCAVGLEVMAKYEKKIRTKKENRRFSGPL